ncbi:S1 family peptidase [Nannocystis pusilla]|uniref:Trypsin-like serine protease n=1 Tax=Nannocystis pusilla TaxID=889268 RepID=A0ABS7TMY6_9BACT|nr:trypsin-like serine protease [Nannocystis pusilla]MBZ5709502.1 trypsin-like serine protease [Nannocystis pusilla]
MRAPVTVAVCGLVALASGPAVAGELSDVPPPQLPIFNGLEAGECDFPSAVAMLDRDTGQLFCTGTLVHPSVVAFAAHCMDPATSWATPGSVLFGEDVDAPVRVVPVLECATHPEWDPGVTSNDLAFCTLAKAVPEVPVVPLIMGCETEALLDSQVTIVGFGATNATLDPEGNPLPTGAGKKRFTTQTITQVSVDDNEVIMIGPDQGGCFGDSGGPAFARMSDGTWRLVGAASTLHPDSFPGPDGEICGLGTVYEIFWPNMDWLEGSVGVDLSPCFDTANNWAPTASCGGFPGDLEDPQSTWSDGCSTTAVGSWSAVCGQPFDEGPFPGPQPEPEPPPPEPEPEPEPPPPEPPPEPEPPPPEPQPQPQPQPAPPVPGPGPVDPTGDDTGDGTGDETGAGADGGDFAERGCTCSSGQDDWKDRSWLLAGLLLLVRRRRR